MKLRIGDTTLIKTVLTLTTFFALLTLIAAGCDSKQSDSTLGSPVESSANSNVTPTKTVNPSPSSGINKTETPTPIPTPTPTPPTELVIMTHDSFDVSKEVIEEFELSNNAKLTIYKAGDAGEVLVRAILEKGNPSADLLYGIDNTYLTRALNENLFLPYKSALLSNVPDHLILDPTFHITPIDFGYVNINYDKSYLAENGLKPPTKLEELTGPRWKSRLVVQNPSTSSTGLAFLIATISYFGEHGNYNYLDFWKDLRANDVAVKDGWSDAYYTDFSQNGGSRPLVVSYATSPAAEVFFSEGKYTEAPTGNVLIDKASFLQVEGIGILAGSNNVELSRQFIDFMLGTRFQEDIPGKMFVYPANSLAKTPGFFKFAEVPTSSSDIDPATISAKREEWIDSWTRTVLR